MHYQNGRDLVIRLLMNNLYLKPSYTPCYGLVKKLLHKFKINKMRKLLKRLLIIQEISNEERYKQGLERLGRGFFEARRLNPFNPLSYITVVVAIIVGIVMFGFVGVWKEMDLKNPFKWD
jgi:hypothetical protein